MDVVKFEDYQNIKKDFYQKHGEPKEYTSNENSIHLKTVVFDDGAEWYEKNELVQEEINGEKHGVPYSFLLFLNKLEFWSTDDSKSKFVYSKGE